MPEDLTLTITIDDQGTAVLKRLATASTQAAATIDEYGVAIRKSNSAIRAANEARVAAVKSVQAEIKAKQRIIDAEGDVRKALHESKVAQIQAATGSRKLAEEYSRVAQEAQRAEQRFQSGGRATQTAVRSYLQLGTNIGFVVNHLIDAARLMGRMVTAFTAASDTLLRMEGQLKLVTSSTAELERVQEELYAVAQRSGSALESTVTLYARMAQASSELEVSQADMLAVTETINQAFQVSGATAEGARNATIQFTQALAGGTVRAEEFNSIVENSPALVRALARGVDAAGGSVGRLRQLVIEGRLSAQEALQAIRDQGGAIADEFALLPETVERASVRARNALTTFLAEVDESFEISVFVAWTFRSLTEALEGQRAAIRDAGGFWAGQALAGAREALEQEGETLQELFALESQDAAGARRVLLEGLTPANLASANLIGGIESVSEAVLTVIGNIERYQAKIAELEAAGQATEALAPADVAQELETQLTELEGRLRAAKDEAHALSTDMARSDYKAAAREVEVLKVAVEEHRGALDRYRQSQAAAGEELKGFTPTQQAAIDKTNKEIATLKEKTATVGLDAQALIAHNAQQIAAATGSEELAESYRKAASALHARQEASKQSAATARREQAAAERTRRTNEASVKGLEAGNALLAEEIQIKREAIATGEDAAETEIKLALARLEAAAAQEGLTEAEREGLRERRRLLEQAREVDAALDAARDGTDILAESQREAILTTGDLRDTFGEMITGFLRGTRSFKDIGDQLADFAKGVGANLFKNLLFGKEGQFDKPLIGNVQGLFGPGGVIPNLFQQGGANSFFSFTQGFFGQGSQLPPGISGPYQPPSGISGPSGLPTGGSGFGGLGAAGGTAGLSAAFFGSGPVPARITSGALGAAAFIPGPQQPFVAAAAFIASLFGGGLFNKPGRIAVEKKGIDQFYQQAVGVDLPRSKESKVGRYLGPAREGPH